MRKSVSEQRYADRKAHNHDMRQVCRTHAGMFDFDIRRNICLHDLDLAELRDAAASARRLDEIDACLDRAFAGCRDLLVRKERSLENALADIPVRVSGIRYRFYILCKCLVFAAAEKTDID